MTTQTETLKLALEALEYIRNFETDVASQTKYGQAAEAIKEALAQPEQNDTVHRNPWTGKATYTCNSCGCDDFRSEHGAYAHKCSNEIKD